MSQLSLPIGLKRPEKLARPSVINIRQVTKETYRERLVSLLSQDFNFNDANGNHGANTFHSFPAKFVLGGITSKRFRHNILVTTEKSLKVSRRFQ